MPWYQRVFSVQFYKTIILTTIGYMTVQTGLFVLSFNLFSLPVRLVCTVLFIIACGYSLKRLYHYDFSKIIQPIIIGWPWLVLALAMLLMVHIKGPLSFNEAPSSFDWFKYNVILFDVAQNPLQPAIQFTTGPVALAYYYAIYLPAGYIGFLLHSYLTSNQLLNVLAFIFDAWLLLGQILGILLLPLVMHAIFGDTKRIQYCGIGFIVFVLFAQMDGWEYLLRTGSLYTSDIEWGPPPAFYAPLRIQSFLSYSYWIPGHLTASMLGLFLLSIFKKTEQLKYLPLFLIYSYTLSSSLFGFISIQLFLAILLLNNTWEEIISFAKTKYKDLIATVVGCSFILVLYGLNSLIDTFPHSIVTVLKLILLAGIGFTVLHITWLRNWLLRYWFWLTCVGTMLIFTKAAVTHTLLFSVYPLSKYITFFTKEFLHYWIIFLIAGYLLYKKIYIPKMIIVAFCLIILLSLHGSGNPDFVFSGSIESLMLISVYLAYLFEQLAVKHKLAYSLLLGCYGLVISLSLYSIYFETFVTVVRAPANFEQRVTVFRQNWAGVFQTYSSNYLNQIRF